jgi:hypothetical protein
LVFCFFGSELKVNNLSENRDLRIGELEKIAMRFRNLLFSQLAGFEHEKNSDTKTEEQKLKSYAGFFKLVQSLEEMINRIQIERDKKSSRGVDILEFRQQLEKQIAKLVDENSEKPVSGRS